jgi:HSP20 family molecular chaperone IbpA
MSGMDSPTQPNAAAEGSVAELAVNLFVTTATVVVLAPLPGVMPEHVEITVDGHLLHIRAARGAEANRDYLLHEWDARRFVRTLDLPEGAGWPVTASLAHGQLTITLARAPDSSSDTHIVVRPSSTASADPPDLIDLRPTDPEDP